jgi:hypothetical protein
VCLRSSAWCFRSSVLLCQIHAHRRCRLGPADLPNTATTRTEFHQWAPGLAKKSIRQRLGRGAEPVQPRGAAAVLVLRHAYALGLHCLPRGLTGTTKSCLVVARVSRDSLQTTRDVGCLFPAPTTQVFLDREAGAQRGELHVLEQVRSRGICLWPERDA